MRAADTMRAFDWTGLWRPTIPPWEVVFRAAVVYAFALLILRLLGRRELGRFSTFDILLLVLVSQAVRQTLVANDTSLTTGMISLVTLAVIDGALSVIAYRSPTIARLLGGPVRLLVRDGQPIETELRESRISRDDLLSLLRAHGRESLEDVHEAFLERSGKVTFIFRDERRDRSMRS